MICPEGRNLVARPSGRVLRGARQQGADLGDDLVLVRELAGRLLRVDIPTVEPDLEDAAGRGDEADATKAILVVVRDLFRQTDGFVQVPSSGAVFHLEVHDALLVLSGSALAAATRHGPPVWRILAQNAYQLIALCRLHRNTGTPDGTFSAIILREGLRSCGGHDGTPSAPRSKRDAVLCG